MPINAEWHGRHPMPKRPTVAERIAWHREHAQRCACRPIPAKLAALMAEREDAPAAAPAGARQVLTILAVGDLPRAARFYTKAFGWRRVVEAPVYVELEQPGGLRLGLYAREGFARNTGRLPGRVARGATTATELYLHVDDLAAAVRRLRAANARELSAPAPRAWGDEAAYFADPDGNVVVVARPLAPAPAPSRPCAP